MMSSTTSAHVINVLRVIFSRFGLPHQLVSDNGTQFVSSEFEHFLKTNGIRHITSAPYHPATNGLAERFVQTFKTALRAMKFDAGEVSKKLAQFLLMYRNTEHSTTKTSPAQLMFGHSLRTRLDICKPSLKYDVVNQQTDQVKSRHGSKMRSLKIGQSIWVRDYRSDQKWRKGVVSQKLGPLQYLVEVDNRLWKRHIDQIREHYHADVAPTSAVIDKPTGNPSIDVEISDLLEPQNPEPQVDLPHGDPPQVDPHLNVPVLDRQPQDRQPRQPRVRHAPNRLITEM